MIPSRERTPSTPIADTVEPPFESTCTRRSLNWRARLGDEVMASAHDHLASEMVLRKLDEFWHLGGALGHIGEAQVFCWNVVADE